MVVGISLNKVFFDDLAGNNSARINSVTLKDIKVSDLPVPPD